VAPPSFPRITRHASRIRPGFTLVEVLAALLLVAIVLPVVMQGISLATGAASAAKRRTEAASLAQSKLAELVGTEGWSGRVLSGRFDTLDGDDAGDYAWRADVTPWTEQYVRQIDVHVTWDGPGGERRVTLSTLVYEGKPEEETEEDEAETGAPGTGGAS
jgi:general secretion pathway protein I